jgi:tetratricopeptide (TPR) repeat protein
VLSEEALIIAAAAGACVLLVLGVLELIWPTRARHARRARAEPATAPPASAIAPPRPAQSILPRRLIDSPSASRPGAGFAFPPPADYIPPPLPREEVRPIRPAEPAAPRCSLDVVVPAASDEEEARLPRPAVYDAPHPLPEAVPPRSFEAETPPRPIEAPVAPPEPDYVASPPVDAVPPTVEVEPLPFEPAPPFEPEPPLVEATPLPIEPEPVPVEPASLPVELEPLLVEPEPPVLEPEPPPVEAARPVVDAVPPPVEAPPPRVDITPPPIEAEPQPIEQIPPAVEPAAPPRESVSPPQPEEPPAPSRRRSKVSPHARPHRVLRPATPEDRSAEQPATNLAPPTVAEAPAKTPLQARGGPAEIDTRLKRDSPLVERCFALYQDKRFDEVVSVGQEALAKLQRESIASSSREAAALWSVVGLAKQALGDDDGAHAALESSIDAASETERATYRRHLVTLALDAAQTRLARAGGHDGGDRIAVIRAAITWTERGLAAVPSDPSLTDARQASHEALWQAYEQAATALLQRQEFPGARQILHEALEEPTLPAARAAGFRGLLSGTFGGEIGQLTAQAILSMQEGRESEALGALQRAEELLETFPSDALPATRRDEVDQRLWWGYAELGSRRLDAGDYEEALDPLVHALRFTSIGPERQAETRGAVVRALEGIAAVRALSIRRLAEAGSRDEAIVAAGELHGLVKRGLELGLTEDELLAAFARVRRLCEELGMDTRA